MKVKSENRRKKAIKKGCLVWWDGTSNPKPLTPYSLSIKINRIDWYATNSLIK